LFLLFVSLANKQLQQQHETNSIFFGQRGRREIESNPDLTNKTDVKENHTQRSIGKKDPITIQQVIFTPRGFDQLERILASFQRRCVLG
jgi:hypothetical protein